MFSSDGDCMKLPSRTTLVTEILKMEKEAKRWHLHFSERHGSDVVNANAAIHDRRIAYYEDVLSHLHKEKT